MNYVNNILFGFLFGFGLFLCNVLVTALFHMKMIG